MANTTVLLREDIDTLGGRGEIVKVKVIGVDAAMKLLEQRPQGNASPHLKVVGT